ncbi:hypothetical protein QBC38DRAFT_407579 [Podospora fimiseda]|uniref:Protein kinase domain-containing protein n=1 Tax=Podospora fimiseda TaxID=252190 RepID=A0AAN7BXW3_9PEZI|nr:hypothetical protein QBC38DRAFT_407579 [Podospora fimiseda]
MSSSSSFLNSNTWSAPNQATDSLDLLLGPDIGAVITATGTRVPLIEARDLTFDSRLGNGTTFEVTRQVLDDSREYPYYVAVKRLLLPSNTDSIDHRDKLRRRNESAARELRVLTASALQGNHTILPLLGYGWTEDPSGIRPYLVVDYSNHGTLPQYLARIRTALSERREFALDVAVGLKALHDAHIIHGDLKPENVLVFDTLDLSLGRVQMAKLSDFGSSIFHQPGHVDKHLVYAGTPLYKAPEQAERGRFRRAEWSSPQHMYMADIYSLGLTLWDVMKSGECYFDQRWLNMGEFPLHFLERILVSEQDGILNRAAAFCRDIFRDSEEALLERAVSETLHSTLREDPFLRSDLEKAIQTLAQGTTEARPISVYPTVRSTPPTNSSGAVVLGTIQLWNTHATNAAAPPAITRKLTSPQPAPHRPHWLSVTERQSVLVESRTGLGDMLDSVMADHTPWSVQQNTVEKLLRATIRESTAPEYFDSCLHLAFCYLTGFGVQPDRNRTMEYLIKSAAVEGIGRDIRARVSAAFNLDQEALQAGKVADHLYFLNRIHHQNQLSMGPAISRGSSPYWSDAEISAALTLACQHGNLVDAMNLCRQCTKFVPVPEKPTPVHWLIMFGEAEVETIGKALLAESGPCKDHIDTVLTAARSVFLPSHCLELFGSPLHWAARTRNLAMVKLLARLGANVNVRWTRPPRTSLDVQNSELSPLDVAVAFHMAEIVQALIDRGADMYTSHYPTKSPHWHSAMHCIGFGPPLVLLFSRFVIHGRHYSEAMRKTVEVLLSNGVHIDTEVLGGTTPLMLAAGTPWVEEYILQEVINAGACPRRIRESDGADTLSILIQKLRWRRFDDAGLRLVAPLVADTINVLDKNGLNPLHYASMSGSHIGIRALSDAVPDTFDINTRNSKGQHAMDLAARLNMTEVISLLVKNYNVPVDILSVVPKRDDKIEVTPLAVAANRKHKEAVDLLLSLGANPDFASSGAHTFGPNLLHLACIEHFQEQESLVEHLLRSHSSLCDASFLNAVDAKGWTVLHKATFYGDVEAVKALLAYGANQTIPDHDITHPMTALELAEPFVDLWEFNGPDVNLLGAVFKHIVEWGPQKLTEFVEAMKEIAILLRQNHPLHPI